MFSHDSCIVFNEAPIYNETMNTNKMKKLNIDLVPEWVNPTPDYYCTWQTQLYATCDGKPAGQRAIIGETGMFDRQKPYGWAYFYKEARGDLLFVMDDSWDVPVKDDPTYYGSLLLNKEKFPAAYNGTHQPTQALKALTQRVKELGWKGLGGWVCAQESERFCKGRTPEQYWTDQLKAAHQAGFAYWKVDWGKKDTDRDFRQMLTRLGRRYAPNLVIEHAKCPAAVPLGDCYRTYDVPAILSIPMTLHKLKELAGSPAPTSGNRGLLNCEDEAYIAAAFGCAMGIMRHPYRGNFVNGKADMSFPAFHRDLKSKMTEVTRAVRWHRLAPAFGWGTTPLELDPLELDDCWQFVNHAEELEEWWFRKPFIQRALVNDILTKSAPARMGRNAPLAQVTPDEQGQVPYTLTCRHPNGAFSVATLGRTLRRQYLLPRCRVRVCCDTATTLGIFGDYRQLTLDTKHPTITRVLMQDLADHTAWDVTDAVTVEGGTVTLPGELIRGIGTLAQPAEDTSEPGVMVRLVTP